MNRDGINGREPRIGASLHSARVHPTMDSPALVPKCVRRKVYFGKRNEKQEDAHLNSCSAIRYDPLGCRNNSVYSTAIGSRRGSEEKDKLDGCGVSGT